MSDRQRHGFVLLLVAGLIAASVFVISTQTTVLGLDLKGGVELVYQGQRTPQSPVTQDVAQPGRRHHALARRPVGRLRAVDPDHGQQPDHRRAARRARRRPRRAGGRPDGPAVLLRLGGQRPDPRPASRRLRSCSTQDPTAITISQGGSAGSRACPAPGGVPLYQAVTLAAKQPVGRPGTLALGAGLLPVRRPGQRRHARPSPRPRDDAGAGTALPAQRPRLDAHRPLLGPAGRGDQIRGPAGDGAPGHGRAAGGQRLSRPRPGQPNSPNAEFFVLKDNVALTGNDITNPQPSTDQSGSPDVTFGFNGKGQSAFQRVTGQIAHRGANVSLGGSSLEPALRGGAGQPAGHRPADRLQASTPTGSSAAAAPTSPAASPARRRRTSPPSCASARCRSSSS